MIGVQGGSKETKGARERRGDDGCWWRDWVRLSVGSLRVVEKWGGGGCKVVVVVAETEEQRI